MLKLNEKCEPVWALFPLRKREASSRQQRCSQSSSSKAGLQYKIKLLFINIYHIYKYIICCKN